MIYPITLVLASLLPTGRTQQVGTLQPEKHPLLPMKFCNSTGCEPVANTQIVLDANWRWVHELKGSSNCYKGNKWISPFCDDPEKCALNCALEGIDYEKTYGITVKDSELKLNFVTKHEYGTNVGSRVYMMDSETKYKNFQLLNQEFTFDVDVSKLTCGLNGALYFVEMDMDGGIERAKTGTNTAGAKYGTGYCDAQCPHDVKFIDGFANVVNWTSTNENSGNGQSGACCAEMDIWEANAISNAYTSHPCRIDGFKRCDNPKDCGDGKNRYKGLCDKDGCDFNPFRLGNPAFYGLGNNFTVDTNIPITVVTQFITSSGTAEGQLVDIRRKYYQGGKEIMSPPINVPNVDPFTSITDKMCHQVKKAFGDKNDHRRKGGLRKLGETLRKGMVLAMSIWVDYEANCLWLDSSYPADADPTLPGVQRGTCPTTSGIPEDVIKENPSASVTYSNIRLGDIGTTVSNAR
ncbi:hypothetical protein ABG067_003650 [Albugo candida]